MGADRLGRRDALERGLRGLGALGCASGLAGLAGCLEALEHEDAWRRLVVDPPEGVYVPPKRDEMIRYGTATVGGREISLLATRPHSFWTVSGRERSRADVRSAHALHLMGRVRDAETNAVVPASVAVDVRRDGERVDRRSLWPMLSQRMGFHYGDNVALEGDGTYEVTVRVGPVDCRATGAFADRLERPATADFDLEYAAAEIESLDRTLLDADEGRGEPGALEPAATDGGRDDERTRPAAVAPSIDSLPGERIGVATAGDVVLPATVLEGFRNVTGGSYLAVVPRTAYNDYVLPFASLSIAGRRDGDRTLEASLRETIHPELGHHYGAAVDRSDPKRVDDLAIALETPPQVARHEGYETAFLETARATVSDGR